MDGKIYERTYPPKKKLMEEILRQLWLVVFPTIYGAYKHRRHLMHTFFMTAPTGVMIETS